MSRRARRRWRDLWPGTVSANIWDVVQRVAGQATIANHPFRFGSRGARAHRLVAIGLAGLVLSQAVAAGQATFGDWEIEVHGWMGNASFALGLLLLVLAVASRAGRVAVGTAAALVVAMFAQVGLGYAGRTALGAASWHIPLGVAIFGLAVCNLTLLAVRPADEGRRR